MFSCSKDNDEITYEELIIQISSDNLYKEVNAQSLKFLKTIKNTIIKNDITLNTSINEAVSNEELGKLSTLLKLPNNYLSSDY